MPNEMIKRRGRGAQWFLEGGERDAEHTRTEALSQPPGPETQKRVCTSSW